MPKPISTLALSWQQQLSQSITDPYQLLAQLKLNPEEMCLSQQAIKQFSLRTPQAYIDKMQANDPEDPLLLQVLNQSKEMLKVEGYNKDPVGDICANKVPGLLHKYHARVLLITTAACAIHCRYCFRRHFPYQEQNEQAPSGQQQWFDYILQDKSISEVILSGGDPLMLTDKKLATLLESLEAIPHLRRLRIHSRLPVVLPDRITHGLIERLARSRLDICMVIHANHANEITTLEVKALKQLQFAGIHLLNQSVLLQGINHKIEDQIDLVESLYSAGVMPYYLHLLDSVEGAAHFNVTLEQALSLIQQMQSQLPGYLVPKLVREITGEASKTSAYEL